MLQHSVGSGNSQASENSNFGTTVVLLITHDIITYHHSGAPKLEKKGRREAHSTICLSKAKHWPKGDNVITYYPSLTKLAIPLFCYFSVFRVLLFHACF